MNWIDSKIKLPDTTSENGVKVIALLSDDKDRMYGNVVMSVFYKGKFHKDFKKGYIQKVSHWLPLPNPPS